jgi:amino acid adenylation domain-containing protein
MLVNEFLEKSAKIYPNKEALICQKNRINYKEIDESANSLSNALINLGFQKQDRAAVYLENSMESVVSIFGILKSSGVFVVINPQVKAGKLEYILNDCQVKVLITDDRHLKTISETLQNCSKLNGLIVVNNIKSDFSKEQSRKDLKTLFFNEILDKCPTTNPPKKCIDIDLASLIYTSGPAKNPKGVILTHLNMVTAANSVIEYLENKNDDIIISCLPLSFDYGLYQILMAFKFGGTVILERSFLYPYQIIDTMIKEKANGFPIVPTMAALLLKLKNLDKYDFSNLRYISNTAQALPPNHIKQLQKLFPNIKIYSMYGLTECKRVSYLPPEKLKSKPTSVGKAMPNTEVYIIDEKGERVKSPGVIGELVVRGANVMLGYWNLPEDTSKTLKPGHYPGERLLLTGDLFKMDEDGDLYFISRKDDMIKTAGERVSPKEIENVLYGLDDVLEAGVIGVPDDILGNAIKAFIALKAGSKLTEKDILQHCSKHLENFMVPKQIEFCKQLPKTSTGKISKKDLI